jgi:actin-like ATPase involved in cell morphogenesis
MKHYRPLKECNCLILMLEKMMIKKHTSFKKENVYALRMVVCIPSGITEVEMER